MPRGQSSALDSALQISSAKEYNHRACPYYIAPTFIELGRFLLVGKARIGLGERTLELTLVVCRDDAAISKADGASFLSAGNMIHTHLSGGPDLQLRLVLVLWVTA